MKEDYTAFPMRQSCPKQSPITGHVVIIVTFAITLTTFHMSYDLDTGKGTVSDGLGVSLTFLMVAYYVGWLPLLWEVSRRRRWFGSLVLPILILLVIPYLYFTFLAYYIQPVATVFVLFVHLISLTYMSCRI